MDRKVWSATIKDLLYLIVYWVIRRRSVGMAMIRGGLSILVTALAGFLFRFEWETPDNKVSIEFDASQGTINSLIIFAVIVATILIVVGIIIEISRVRREYAALDRKRVFVIEQRGLRDTADTPLENAVPKDVEGRRETILVDLRQGVEDGRIVNPTAALRGINILPHQLEQQRASIDRADVSVVYGGLAPVPYAFLTGFLLDNESTIIIMDWDRDADCWRTLDAEDDGDRFSISGLEHISDDTADVIVTVSVSYKVNLPAVRKTVGDWPLVTLDLPNGSTNCHWSDSKQRALAQQFRNAMENLCNRRVGRVHLFIAAQNSVTFRLGRSYDKRNMPSALVYQSERSSVPPYPWAVALPTHGVEGATIVKVSHEEIAG